VTTTPAARKGVPRTTVEMAMAATSITLNCSSSGIGMFKLRRWLTGMARAMTAAVR